MGENNAQKQEGPSLRIVGSCGECKYSKTEKYYGENDYTELAWYCNHNDDMKYVGSSQTPKWCPLYNIAMEKLLQTNIWGDGL